MWNKATKRAGGGTGQNLKKGCKQERSGGGGGGSPQNRRFGSSANYKAIILSGDFKLFFGQILKVKDKHQI